MRGRNDRRRRASLWAIAGLVAFGAATATAQPSIKVRIWELQLGTPVTELPPQYLDPHCGTNGGPPSIALAGWADFGSCPAEPATGLHEVWFTEDDELEYVARAYRTQGFDPGPSSANVLLNHKVIYSLLVDDDGLVRGYRVFTDSRETESYRFDADFVGEALRGLYGYTSFECTDLAREEGERAVEGHYVNRICIAIIDGRHITIERRLLRKPGQTVFNPVTRQATVGYFESSTQLEVVAADLVPD